MFSRFYKSSLLRVHQRPFSHIIPHYYGFLILIACRPSISPVRVCLSQYYKLTYVRTYCGLSFFLK